ncbi:MAG: hypothetical protein JWM12_3479 [Ilumatobacteraceae bacterium]|nr:hypothetical protein [Ilumatobacteraceae bacterium]
MSCRLLSVGLIALFIAPSATGGVAAPGGSCGSSSVSIGCSVGGAGGGSGGGSASGVTCDAWVAVPDDAYAAVDFASSEIRDDGIVWRFYTRNCTRNGITEQDTRWFPLYTSRQLATNAYDSVQQLVPPPDIQLSRPADDLIVNVDTTITITPIPPVTATADVPGLAATVTATATRIDVSTGSQVPTDTRTISCQPWGGDTCVWTPRYPSVEKVTGTTDHRHHGTASIVWHVTWTATDNTSGTLDDLTTTTELLLAVREIQTIGGNQP